jgi:hypothetical protein
MSDCVSAIVCMSPSISTNHPVTTVRKRGRTTKRPERGLVNASLYFLVVDTSQNAGVSVSAPLNAITTFIARLRQVESCSRVAQPLMMRAGRGFNVTTRDRLALSRAWTQNGGLPLRRRSFSRRNSLSLGTAIAYRALFGTTRN